LTFEYAGKSGVNSGIIATIFTTTVLFTAILFRVKYGQKLTIYDIIGCFGIISGVILISLGAASAVKEKSPSEKS